MAALKLAYFVVERAAEPLSTRLETAAARSASFRTFCGHVANWQSGLEHGKARRRQAREAALTDVGSDGYPDTEIDPSGVLPMPVLSEKEATQRGCALLGEAFVLSVALGVLLHQSVQERHDAVEQQKLMDANAARIAELERSQKMLTERLQAVEASRDARNASQQGGDRAGPGLLSWARSSNQK